MIDPFIQFCVCIHCWAFQILSIKRQLKWNVEEPILLSTTTSYKVNSFTSLQNLEGEFVAEEWWDHDVIQTILLSPKLLVWYTGISIDKKFAEWIVYLSLNHPCFYHWEYGCWDFLEYPIDELLSAWAPIHSECIDGWANCSSFEILNWVNNDCKPFHPIKWLLHPKIELP